MSKIINTNISTRAYGTKNNLNLGMYARNSKRLLSNIKSGFKSRHLRFHLHTRQDN